MTNKVRIYRSSTATTEPVNGAREFGELAVNTTDKKLWVYNENKVPVQLIGPVGLNVLRHDGSTSTQIPTESL